MLKLVIASWLVAGLLLSAARAGDWGAGELRLWGQAHVASPDKPRPLVNLGNARFQRGDVLGARLAYTQALEVSCGRRRTATECREGTVAARANLIVLDAATGDLDRARADFATLADNYPLQNNLRDALVAVTR